MAVPEQITLDPLKVTLDPLPQKVTLDPLPQKVTLDPLPQKQPGPIDRFLLGAKERAAKFGAEFKAGLGPESAVELWATESLPANIVKGAARVGEKSWKSLVREQQKELDVMTGRAKGPDHASMLEELKSLGVTAEQHPGLLVGSLVKGLITDPELLLPYLWRTIPNATAIKVAQAARAMGLASATAEKAALALGTVTGRMGAYGAAGGAVEASKQFAKGDYDLGEIGTAAGETALLSAIGPTKLKSKAKVPVTSQIPRSPAEVPTSSLGEAVEALHEATKSDPVTPEMIEKVGKAPPVEQSTATLLKTLKQAATGAAVGAGAGYIFAGKERKAVGVQAGAIGGALFPLLKGKKFKGPDIAALVNARNDQVEIVKWHVYQTQRKLEELVPDKARRDEIGVMIDTGVEPAQGSKDHEFYTSFRKPMRQLGELAKEAGVIEELRDNYISHMVEDDPNGKEWYERIFGGGGGTSGSAKSFGMERKWATFEDLQQALKGSGLRVKTTDPSEIFKIYANSVYKAIANKRLLNDVKKIRMADGSSLVLPTEKLMPEAERKLPPSTDEAGAARAVKARAARAAKASADRIAIYGSDKSAPQNWKQIPNPSLAGIAFHPEIAPDIKFIFGANELDAPWKQLHALTSTTKRVTVSASLFHAKTLSEGHLLAKDHSRQGSIRTAMKMFREGGNNSVIDTLIKGGLRLSTPEDVAGQEVQNLAKWGDALNEKFPLKVKGVGAGHILKGAAAIDKATERMTFGYLQTGMKLVTAMQQYETLLRSGVSEAQAAKSAAAFANDVYGSLDWYRVATDTESHILRKLGTATLANNGRKVLQILMFAPDWTFATFRSMARSMPGGTDAVTQQLYRRYLLKSAIWYLVAGNGVNYALSGHSIFDNDNPTRIELPDGRTMQFAKHETENLDWLRHPVETGVSKFAFGPRLIAETYRAHELSKAYKKPMPTPFEDVERIGTEMAPISLQQFIQNGFDAEAVGGALGFPIYGKKPPPHVPVQPERGEQ